MSKSKKITHTNKNKINDSEKKSNKNALILWSKIFLIGLLLQFFLHTLFTFQFGLTGTFWNIVWLWKEIFILLGLSFVVYLLVQKYQKRKATTETTNIIRFFRTLPLQTYIVIFIITLVVILAVSLIDSNIINYIISVRYSMIGFAIFIIASYLGYYAFTHQENSLLLQRYKRIIKSLLILGLLRWGLVRLMPNALKFFGYDKFAHEGEVGNKPPTVYYTEYNKGLVRNQFLFERPISYGFFLIALWPLFFVLAIKGKHPRELLWRGGIYGLNVFSTFSRAARGAWILQTLLLFLIIYHKNRKKMLVWFVGPALLGIGVISYFAADQIIHRQFSNTGHMKEVKIALNKIKANPLLGAGVGSAGPASHQIQSFEPYNTENQYLQIWVEYGIIGFVLWMCLYLYLHFVGYVAWKDKQHTLSVQKEKKYIKKNKIVTEYNFYIMAFSLGLLGLSIENMVLHGFVDRMIVYPLMLLFGLSYGVWIKEKERKS